MNKTDLAKLDRGTLVALIFKQTASVTGAFEEWTSDLTHAGNYGFWLNAARRHRRVDTPRHSPARLSRSAGTLINYNAL